MANSITASGLVWRIGGTPGTTNTTITLLVQGQYASVIRKHPDIRQDAAERLADYLRRGAPVDTGRLRASIRIVTAGIGPTVILGPDKYNRAQVKAMQAGRQYRPRKRRPRLTGFYAMHANERSRRPQYIEKAIDRASAEIARELTALRDLDIQEATTRAVARSPLALPLLRRGGPRVTRPPRYNHAQAVEELRRHEARWRIR